MRGLIAALSLMALSGCLTSGAPTVSGTRDASVAMSSIATLDPMKFSGRWYEVEAFVPDGASCVLGAVTFTVQKNGDLMVTEGPCADGAPRQGLARRIGPGRYAFDGDELWVLWVDAEYHVAVIGAPRDPHMCCRARCRFPRTGSRQSMASCPGMAMISVVCVRRGGAEPGRADRNVTVTTLDVLQNNF